MRKRNILEISCKHFSGLLCVRVLVAFGWRWIFFYVLRDGLIKYFKILEIEEKKESKNDVY